VLGWRFQRRHRSVEALQEQFTKKGRDAIPWHPIEQKTQLDEMRYLLESQNNQQKQDGQLSEKISELTVTMNRFMNAMEEGQKKEPNIDKEDEDEGEKQE